jgi:hypothetical protein
MHNGICTIEYTQSLIHLISSCGLAGHSVSFSFILNQSLITRARNTLVHNFLKTSASHLMFIDADMRFDGQDVIRMIAANVDIICGIYPKKIINWQSVAHAVKNKVPSYQLSKHTGSFVSYLPNNEKEIIVPTGQPAEIAAGGTGFMLIERKVFEKLKPVCPEYLDEISTPRGQQTENVIEYFDTSISSETNRLLNEDYNFCRIWRNLGGKVHCAPWVKTAHVGTYTFEG